MPSFAGKMMISVGAAGAIIRTGLADCERELKEIALRVENASRVNEASNQAGPAIEQAREVLARAQNEFAQHAIKVPFLSRFPMLGSHLLKRWQSEKDRLCENAFLATQNLSTLERALHAERKETARSAALAAVRISVQRLRQVRARLQAVDKQMLELPRDSKLPEYTSGEAWLSELERFLEAPARGATNFMASPINNNEDTTNLNTTPRSPIAAFGRGFDQKGMTDSVVRRWCLLPTNRPPAGIAGFALHTRSPFEVPVGIFEPRVRGGIPLLPGSHNKIDRVYLPAPVDCVEPICAGGGMMAHRGGFYIDPRDSDGSGVIAPYLPFIAQRHYVPLMVELIPRSSWGASLANLLTPASWGGIRKSVTARFGGLCQICGQLRKGQSIECHEVWEYEDNAREHGMAIQRLVALLSVCKACHGMFHLGFSEMRGHGDAASYRLADVNGWSMAELEAAQSWMRACVDIRSKMRWALDVSLVATDQPLVVSKGSWEFVGDRLSPKDREGEEMMILGSPYRLGVRGDIIEAQA